MADGKLRTVIEIDHRAFDQGLARIDKQLAQSEKKAKQFGKSLDSSTSNLGRSLASLAARYVSLGAAITLVTKTVRSAISLNTQFERKNSELASVLGTTKDGVKDLTKAAEDLGRVTEFTATEVTELQLALARLGFTKTQILDMQGTVLKFAAAVNADLGRAANFAGSALRGFGLEAKDSTHLLDVMAAATTKSALDFSKLETSISIVAPVAHAFGLTAEDTVTLLGALSNAGFDASSAATATRNILLNLADANGKLAKGLGHSARTFPEIIDALKECKEKGLDLNTTLEMTTTRTVSAFNALIDGSASADELRNALGSVDGTLEQMYETMTDNLAGAAKQLQSAWEGLLLKFQEANGPMAEGLRGLAKLLNEVTDNASEFGRDLIALIATFGVYKASLVTMNALKSASMMLTKGWTAAEIAHFGALTATEKAQALLNKTLLKNPYAIVAAAVAALAFGIYKMATYTTDAEKAMQKLDKADKQAAASAAAERVQVDMLFGKLKAAKEGTEEYDRAKKAIMSKYGQYLSKLGDEKTALNDIALAYKTITEEATKAAKARAMESFTASAADDYGKSIADTREAVHKLLVEKFGDAQDGDGVSLAETYFWKIVPVLEGQAELDDELAGVVKSFDQVISYTAGTAGQTYSYVTNAMETQLNRASNAAQILTDVMAEAERRFGTPSVVVQDETPDPNANGNNGGGNGGHTPTDEEKKEAKRYGDAFKKAVREMWKEVANTEVDAMKEGTAKKLAQINNEEKQALAAIDEEFKELEKAAKKSGNKISQATLDQFEQRRQNTATAAANKRQEIYDEVLQNQLDYLETYGSYKEKELAIEQKYAKDIAKEQDEWKRKSLEQERIAALAELHERQLAYLEEYGTYKEKEAAITERYNQRIARSNDEVEKATLAKERDKALRELEQDNDFKYALIFADAQSLSKSVLQQAIDATQEAIKKARESGDIQALTELYGRLREQMNVQSDRSRGWGFAGISQGFALRNSANEKRSLADVLEGQLAKREETLELMKTFGVDEEKIEAARKKIEELRAEIQRLRDDATNDDENALGFLEKGFSEVSSTLSTLGSEMASFRDNLGGACDTIADIGEGLSALASQSDTISAAFSGSMTDGERWAAAIQGTIQLAAMIGQSIVNNKKAQEEWNRTIEQSEHKLAMLKLEAMDYKQQNIFGVENPYKKAIDGAKQYQSSMEELYKMTDKLGKGQVQTGTKKVVDWANVGKGAGIGAGAGAAVGSFFGPIGAAIGAAIGAGVGAIAGAISTKTVPVFESLSSKYGQLFNPDTYELNEQLLADYDKLDDATKQIVDNWQEIVDKAKEAEDQMRENFSSLAGDIGNQLSDALVSAFRNGDLYAAVDDFHAKMTSTIEDIMEQLVFSSTMGAMFDELEDRMMKSFGIGGDNDLVDDLIWMEGEYQKRLEQYNEAMGQVQQSLRGLGYEAWEGDQRTAQTKAALGASQDSVDESNARLTTIQGHTFELNENVRSIRMQHEALIANTAALLEHVQGIHSDTSEMKAAAGEMQKMMQTIKSGVGTIVDKGVKAL